MSSASIPNLFIPLPVPDNSFRENSYKTLQTVENLYRELVKLEADRSSLLVGVGGGLTTDVAGFVASTFLREIPFGFISTPCWARWMPASEERTG